MIERPPLEQQPISGTENTYHSSRSTAVERRPWSPAQLVALILGVVFVVLGGIALARTGIDIHHLSYKHVKVAGAGQTQLAAYIEIVFGALLLAAGALPGGGRGGMIFLGIVSFIFGIIVEAQPSSFYNRLGIGTGYALFLILVGIVLLVTAMVAPVYWMATRRYGTTGRYGTSESRHS